MQTQVMVDNGWISTDGSHFVSCQIRSYDGGYVFWCIEHHEKLDSNGDCPGAISRYNELDHLTLGSSDRPPMQFKTYESTLSIDESPEREMITELR